MHKLKHIVINLAIYSNFLIFILFFFQFLRLASNDYENHHPRVTRNRIFWSLLSQVSFLCAFGFFRQTQICMKTFNNNTNNYLEITFFCVVTSLHELFLCGLLFSPFFDAVLRWYRAHLALKSLGEVAVMILTSQLLQWVVFAGRHDQSRRLGESYFYSSSEVASMITWLLLNIDALAVVNLVRPGYHYSIFEVTATLTVHLSMESRNDLPFLSWFVISGVFVILLVKNFAWPGVNYNVHG